MQNIIGLTMITNPDYRQDPWEASIKQALEVFDMVVVVCGAAKDVGMLATKFSTALGNRLFPTFLHWPQPEWTYDELPKHLNHGLTVAREMGADWVVKFDIDTFFHENEKKELRQKLEWATPAFMACSFEKYQFHTATACYEKGKMPLALNIKKHPNLCYGLTINKYNDLCQPIIWDNEALQVLGKGKYPMPVGGAIPLNKIYSTGIHVWNYDYTFKTYERSKELLYNFDRAHAFAFSVGYTGKGLEEITPETAMQDFLGMTRSRAKRANKVFEAKLHPKHVQTLIVNLTTEQFGHSLWAEHKL